MVFRFTGKETVGVRMVVRFMPRMVRFLPEEAARYSLTENQSEESETLSLAAAQWHQVQAMYLPEVKEWITELILNWLMMTLFSHPMAMSS